MEDFWQWLEAEQVQYIAGWDSTVHLLKNWQTTGSPKDTPKTFCQRNIQKLQNDKLDDYQQGVLDAMIEFLKTGKIEFRGTSSHANDSSEERPSPFSPN